MTNKTTELLNSEILYLTKFSSYVKIISTFFNVKIIFTFFILKFYSKN